MGKRPNLFRIIRNKFVAGLIILVPSVITLQTLWVFFRVVEERSKPLADALFGRGVPGLGFITATAVVFVTGLLFSAGPLKRLLDSLEDVIEYIPFIGVVYGTLKRVFKGFGAARSQEAFKRFVLARLKGRTTPGFLTGSFKLEQADGTVLSLCTVYVPTNHLYVGDVVVLSSSDVIETDLSVEEGISVILSAGASVPSSIRQVGSKTRVEPL